MTRRTLVSRILIVAACVFTAAISLFCNPCRAQKYCDDGGCFPNQTWNDLNHYVTPIFFLGHGAPPQTITGVSPSTASYTSGITSGATIAAVGVGMSPVSPASTATLALSTGSAADFSLSSTTLPSNIVANGSTPTCTSSTPLSFNLVATQPGATGSPYTQAVTVTCNPASTGNVTFTALHTYYMSPTGSDSNNGTSAGTAWATPNHAVVCGDVIIAASGTYNANFAGWGVVSNCPSMSGGIDGTGGVYFATMLCGGDLGSSGCIINCATGACAGTAAMNITNDNWAIEGWQCNGNGNSTGDRCYQVYASTASTIYHHVAFINDIAYNANQAYGGNDFGLNHSLPGSGGNGVDYVAVIGMYAQNTGGDVICLGSIHGSGMANSDTNAGTHLIFYGNINIKAAQPSGCVSDGEAYLWDTWDAHGFQGTGVEVNNIGTQAARAGWAGYYQALNVGSTSTVWKIYNNTMYADEQLNSNQSLLMEYNLQSATSALPYLIEMYNNIGVTQYPYQGNASSNGTVYALNVGGNYGGSGSFIGGSGEQNIFKGNASTCTGTCDSGNNVEEFNGGSFGTNTYVSPAFTNTTDLLANRLGAPNCTGFTNTTACNGYNATTSTLTTPSIISDLVPTAGGMTGKGYQLPSTTCASGGVVADYPAWLKGVVYLHWNGTSITENADLVTKPCGL